MRLFIAVQFERNIQDLLFDGVIRLKQIAVQGNFTLRENLHLTLVFIGETTRQTDIERAMDTMKSSPFTMKIGGVGKFRSEGGDLYWAGVERSRELLSAYRQLWDSLTREGFSLENREYKPHLTLGRKVILPENYDKESLNMLLPEMSAAVDSIHLMKSERIGGQMQYTSVYEKKLK